MGVDVPLEKNRVALFRRADRVEHVAVALRMHRFLKRLNREAEIDFARRDVFADVGQIRRLDAVEKNQERKRLVVGDAFRGSEAAVILHVLPEIDLLGNPKIVHRLPIPVRRPFVLHVVEVVQIRRVSVDHALFEQIRVSEFVEKRFPGEFFVHGTGEYARSRENGKCFFPFWGLFSINVLRILKQRNRKMEIIS